MEQHGGDIYRNEVNIDFSVNINPFGMSEACKKAYLSALSSLEAYPDMEGEALTSTIRTYEGLQEEAILLGNGAAELFYGLCYALKPKKILLPVPCFSEYERAGAACGAEIVHWELKEENGFQLTENFLASLTNEIDLLFLCNPNNPTGQIVSMDFIEKIVERCGEHGIFLCMDECFLPFLEEESSLTIKHRLMEWKHCMVVRAFTKIFAMPGLRLGYGILGDKELAKRIRLSVQSWNTSIPAQMVGLAALSDLSMVKRVQEHLKRERPWLEEQLLKEHIAEVVYPGFGDYIFFKGRLGLKEQFLEQGILIRSCANYPGLDGHFYRIAVKLHEENCRLVYCFKESR